MLPGGERLKWLDPEPQYTSLIELLRFRASVQGDGLAYTFLVDGQTPGPACTYAELDQQARALGTLLQSMQAHGERALLLYPLGLEFVTGFWGCLYAGAVAIPAPPPDALRFKRTLPRLQTIAQDAQATLVLTTSEILSQVEEFYAHVPSLRALRWVATDGVAIDLADTWQPPQVNGGTLAYLQYTSGSTSSPKGVMVSHANLLMHSASIRQGCGYTPESVTVTWLPHFHDYGLIQGQLQPLYNGNPCWMMSPLAFIKRPLRWLEAIARYQGTHSQAPNFAYEHCVRHTTPEQRAALDVSSWIYAGNGAEPINFETVERFIEAFSVSGFRREAFSPAYGLAEGTLVVSSSRTTEGPLYCAVEAAALEQHLVVESPVEEKGSRVIVSCGHSMPGRTIAIVHPTTGKRCAPDEVGEIWVSDSCVAEGYWNRPEDTEATFRACIADTGEGPFLRTGDLGFLRDGQLYITGRYKDLIIIAGSNHYPQDIEWTTERAHPSVRLGGCAAFSVEVDGEERLVVLAEVDRPKGDLDQVLEAIHNGVADSHEIEVYSVAMLKAGGLLKTSSGKIQRRSCQAAFLEGSLPVLAAWTKPITPPRSSSEGHPHTPARSASKSPSLPSETAVQEWLLARLAERLILTPTAIDIHEPLSHYGLVSRDAVALVAELEDWLGRQLSPVLVYQCPTVAALTRYLTDSPQEQSSWQPPDSRGPHREPIAVIGLGCRFPGASNPESFWRLLCEGIDAVTEVPEDRWPGLWYSQDQAVPGKMNTRWGGFLKGVDLFDASFFGVVPGEAVSMDPQQRLLLEVAWESLEHAGLMPARLAGSQTGVFIGISTGDYGRMQMSDARRLGAYAGTGSALSIAANRLSYYFDLRGPSLAVDTACSSSLVAVHLAMEALREGRAELALAGGVNLILSPEWSVTFSQAGLMSPDGRCKTFDADANGYVRGEGCGIVVLKRLSDALRDGNTILALLQGSAINQDGRSNGLTAPNPLAQEKVLQLALADARIDPHQINYVEAHGTGTALGDPIEVQALASVLGANRDSDQRLIIGSVKTNIGHLESAAGIAGLIKVVLALQHGEIPPHLHFQQPNPYIPWEKLPVLVPTNRMAWGGGKNRRLAGVSSFGFGGTNAHVVLEAYKASNRSPNERPERPLHLLTLSAKTEPALLDLSHLYRSYLETHPAESLADVGYTANTTRALFAHRLAVVATDATQALEKLGRFVQTGDVPGVLRGVWNGTTRPKVAFLFSGQGSQYVGMGRRLYDTEPTFRRALQQCDSLLQPHLQQSLLDLLYAPEADPSLLDQTAYTQPALFALEYALTQLWLGWGVTPDILLGHSVAEYVAACVAGVFSLEDALRLVAVRARLMQELSPGGGMAAVFADHERVAELVGAYGDRLAVAAYNGPENTVISGSQTALDEVLGRLEAEGVRVERLAVSHAFHSPLLEPMLDELEAEAARVRYGAPRLKVMSNLTGRVASGEELCSAGYWRRQAREAVQFAEGMRSVAAEGCRVYVEIGPGTTLLGMGRRCVSQTEDTFWLPSLRRNREDWNTILESLASLHTHGVQVDWHGFDRGYTRKRVSLPTYPFQRRRYWLETGVSSSASHPEVHESGPGIFQLQWQLQAVEANRVHPTGSPTHWLLFADQGSVAETWAQHLQEQNQSFHFVWAGDSYRRGQRDAFQINSHRAEDYQQLLRELDLGEKTLKIVYCWGLDSVSQEGTTISLQSIILKSCTRVLHLIQALAGSEKSARTRLWIITRCSQSVGNSQPRAITLEYTPLWGLGRVIALEYPDLWGGLIDLDSEPTTAVMPQIFQEISTENGEDQIAYRDNQRYLPRLVSPIRMEVTEWQLHEEATYLVTGGLGGLGLQVTQWLIERGARHVVLVNRRSPTPANLEYLKRLEQSGASIETIQGDVSHEEDVQRVLSTIAETMPPLRGVVHAAGVLDDGVLLRQNEERFARVLASKVAGAWNLHTQTQGLSLDFFVLYSSAASLLGSPGQGNYAAANAVLDGLAHYRRRQGLPALSINWGPWAETGMATRGEGHRQKQRGFLGMPPLNPGEALNQLDHLLSSSATNAAVLPRDWSWLTSQLGGQPVPRILADLVKPVSPERQPITQDEVFLTRIERAASDERSRLFGEMVRAEVARLLGVESPQTLDGRKGFFDLGMDSLMAVEFRNRLQSKLSFSPPLPASLVFDYPTVEALSEYLGSRLAPQGKTASVVSKKAHEGTETIAIVGLGCRFPGGAQDAESFWRLLAEGVDAVTEIPSNRWDIDAYFDANPGVPGKMYTLWGGFLNDVSHFDAQFFGIAPREALTMDPQQRLLLEVVWESLENAGLAPDQLSGSATGVFVGISGSDYSQLLTMSGDPARIDTYYGTGNSLSAAAGRVSYILGLRGPSMAIDTACSSSLVAVHLACESLLRGECHTALACGVNLILSPVANINLSLARMLAHDSHCKTFDAAADGYVRGEGCGVIVLKRLSEALEERLPILAVIRGSAVNQDGRSTGLTAPNGPSQEALIRDALARAGVEPRQVSYLEAHGTGTPLGDPIEVQALAKALGDGRPIAQPVAIGSVKTNIGHLEAAAGIAGLIKVVLALRHQQIPPHLHYHTPNPYIPWQELPVVVPSKLTSWDSPHGKRIAGVSSFGFIGTNAHVVLEEAPTREIPTSPYTRPRHVITLAASTPTALRELARRWEAHLRIHPEQSLADTAYTANVGRSSFSHRLAVAATDTTTACNQLGDFCAERSAPHLWVGEVTESDRPRIAFLFSGQGSQYVGMGRRLYDTQPTFRQSLQQCDSLLQPYLQRSLLDLLYAPEADPSRLDQTAYTQPALFALEYALTQLWLGWGVTPDILLGHSVGEYVAACVAGVFSLEDALRLVAVRARLMQELPSGGGMAAVFADHERVAAMLGTYEDRLVVAAYNGPENTVISGSQTALDEVLGRLEAEGVRVERLAVSHAFHSPLLEPMLDELEAEAARVRYGQPQLKVVSNLTGRVASGEELCSAGYWRRHAREGVRFAEGIRSVAAEGCRVYVEIGLGATLLGMGRRCLSQEEDTLWLPSLRRNREDWETILDSIAKLHVHGGKIDWQGFDRDYPRQRVSAPTYPFQRQHYWIPTHEQTTVPANGTAPTRAGNSLLGQRVSSPVKEILFQTRWDTQSFPELADHRLFDQVVVPGAWHLVALLEVAREQTPSTELELQQVSFREALTLGDSQTVEGQIILAPRESGSWHLQLFSQTVGDSTRKITWTQHAEGLRSSEPKANGNLADGRKQLDDLKAECKEELEGTEFYSRMQTVGIDLGPSFQWLGMVWSGPEEALGQMRPFTGKEAAWPLLPPGLLDACFQLVAAALPQERRFTHMYVPLGVDRLRYHGRGEGKLWSHARVHRTDHSSETFTATVRLFTETGEDVLLIEGLHVKLAGRQHLLRASSQKRHEWLHQINWQESSRLESVLDSTNPAREHWLILADRAGLGRALARRLLERGDRCTTCYLDDETCVEESGSFRIKSHTSAEFSRLLQDCKQQTGQHVQHIVYLWGLDQEIPAQGSDQWEPIFQRTCGSSLHLIQAIARSATSPRLWLVTRGSQLAPGQATLPGLAQTALWGLGRTLALEHPEFRSVCLDLDPVPTPEEVHDFLLELTSPDGEQQVMHRSGKRFLARLIQQPLPPAGNGQPVCRDDATYLITGGTGGLGLKFAEWLVEKGARHLVLISRGGGSIPARARIDELRQSGVQIVIAQADVSEMDELGKVLAEVRSSLPPLQGVVHAAGVLQDGVLLEQSWEQFSEVLGPKVEGAWNLHILTQDTPLDFFVLFSSAASLLGSPGQGNYASANAFLDGLAHYRRAAGLPAIAINWGPWDEVGMATRGDKRRRNRWSSQGLEKILPGEGVALLEEILAHQPVQTAVLPITWSIFLRQFDSQPFPGFFKEVAPEKGQRVATASEKKAEFRVRYQSAPTREQPGLLLAHLREQVSSVLRLSAAQVLGVKTRFFEIGMDSLMALDLRTRLQQSIGEPLSSTVIFDHPSLETLSSYLTTHILQPNGIREEDPVSEEEPSALVEGLKDLSEEALEQLLMQKLESLQQRSSS